MFTEQWKLAANALNGDGGFDNGDMLVKYPRETDDKYKMRKEVAYYVNHMKRSCHRFSGYLSKQPASRATSNNLLQAVVDNCDMKGNHISQFMQAFSIQVKARGSGLILVDMPKLVEGSKDEQLKDRNAPYFVSINPERVTDYKLDKFGAFEYIEFSDTYTADDEKVGVTRRYDKSGWKVFSKDKTYDQGAYSIGICPIIPFSETGSFPGLGSYYQIAELSKRLYNAQSELDEILRGQTFSILTYQVPKEMAAEFDAEKVGSTVGTQNMLVHHGIKPEFAAPTSIPAKTYQEYIENLEDRINAVANNVDLGAQNQSGAALTLRFQNMNSELLNFARQLEDFERKLFYVVGKWLGSSGDIAISYPSDFNIIDKVTEIEVLQNMIDMNAPKSYINEKMRQIISTDLIGMDAEKEAEIFAELDEASHERD